MSARASQITSLSIVYSTVYSGADQRKHQSSASLAFVRGIHRWSVHSPHKRQVTWIIVSIWWHHHASFFSYRVASLPSQCLYVYPIGRLWNVAIHYDDVIMTMLASQITSLTVVYSIVYSGVNQRKHQSSASLAFVWEIHRGPVNFPHKWPVTRKMFLFDDVIMKLLNLLNKRGRVVGHLLVFNQSNV